jgi:hypothetical protein
MDIKKQISELLYRVALMSMAFASYGKAGLTCNTLWQKTSAKAGVFCVETPPTLGATILTVAPASVAAFLIFFRTRSVDSLFRRFTVEVFVVGFCFGASMVDNTVPMIRRRIERIELHWNTTSIDDVVIRAGWYEHGKARADHRANTVENGLPRERS